MTPLKNEPRMDCLLGKTFKQVELVGTGGPWMFRLSDGVCLSVGSCWQIVADGRVKLANADHGQRYGLSETMNAISQATAILAGRSIEGIILDGASADLTIELNDGVQVRTFNDSSGYEAWDVAGPDGPMFVVQGGGNFVVFDKD